MRQLMIALTLAAGLSGSALAQVPAGPIYVVTHVDLAPPPAPSGASQAEQNRLRAQTGERGLALLSQMAASCSPAAGCLRFEVLQTVGAANHLTMVSVWKDQAALEFFEGVQAVKAARAQLAPFLGSPFDQRLHLLAR
jgi:quinol monooxygenase YgiN